MDKVYDAIIAADTILFWSDDLGPLGGYLVLPKNEVISRLDDLEFSDLMIFDTNCLEVSGKLFLGVRT